MRKLINFSVKDFSLRLPAGKGGVEMTSTTFMQQTLTLDGDEADHILINSHSLYKFRLPFKEYNLQQIESEL